jgi:hypothetical protein
MSINQNSRYPKFIDQQDMSNNLIITELTEDIGDGTTKTIENTIGCRPLLFSLVAGQKVTINGQDLEIYEAAAAGATSFKITETTFSVPVMIGDRMVINQQNLFEQYQNKTEGSIAGFTIDADGIAKGGIEITGFLDSDTMTGATANNIPTAESVKAYVDASSPSVNLRSCSVSPESVQTISSGGTVGGITEYNDITLDTYNITQVSPYTLTDGVLHISMTGTYLINFSMASKPSGTNNRLLVGYALYTKLSTAASYTHVNGTLGYNYDRGTQTSGGASTWGSIFEGSSSGNCIITIAELDEGQTQQVKMGWWIDGRSTSASGEQTIVEGIILTAVKIA